MIINLNWLKKHRACREGIEFFERNFLSKELDLDSVEIEGDYKGYFNWIEEELFSKWKYDDKGNKIEKIYPSGDVYKYEYDSHGNCIEQIYSDGSIYKWKYDKNNNCIKEICPSGNVWKWEFYHNNEGNLIKIEKDNKVILEIKYRRKN